MGKYLEIEDIRKSLNGLEKCEMLAMKDIQPTVHQPCPWPGSKDQQNKTYFPIKKRSFIRDQQVQKTNTQFENTS